MLAFLEKKSLSEGCEAVGVSSFRWRNVELIIVSIRELNFPNETHDRKINSYLRLKDSPMKLLNARHFLAQSGFVPPSPPLCMEALGMQSGRIKPDALQASSQYDANHGADNGRLHFQKTGSRIGAWSAKTADGNQYIQAKFDVVAKVRRVATQGRMDADQWVKTYTLAYSFDGKTWKDYKLNNIVTVRSQICAVVDVFGMSVAVWRISQGIVLRLSDFDIKYERYESIVTTTGLKKGFGSLNNFERSPSINSETSSNLLVIVLKISLCMGILFPCLRSKTILG